MNKGTVMKKSTLIIIALAAVSIISLGTVYVINSDEIKSYSEGTSFQGHSEGKYGPVGAGGYGLPDLPDKAK
jgi:hypothetical protein